MVKIAKKIPLKREGEDDVRYWRSRTPIERLRALDQLRSMYANMLLLENKDFREFIKLLNSHEVRFLIVGGHAVTFHGYPRYTGDLDIWVAIDASNAVRVEKVLTEFGFGSIFSAEDFSKAGYAIQLGRPPYRIDILTSIDGVEFEDAYRLRKIVEADRVKLAFIGLNELLANKRSAGRPQDQLDVAKLDPLRAKSLSPRRKLSAKRPSRNSARQRRED